MLLAFGEEDRRNGDDIEVEPAAAKRVDGPGSWIRDVEH